MHLLIDAFRTLPRAHAALSIFGGPPAGDPRLFAAGLKARAAGDAAIGGASGTVPAQPTPFKAALEPGAYLLRFDNGGVTPAMEQENHRGIGQPGLSLHDAGFDADRTAAELSGPRSSPSDATVSRRFGRLDHRRYGGTLAAIVWNSLLVNRSFLNVAPCSTPMTSPHLHGTRAAPRPAPPGCRLLFCMKDRRASDCSAALLVVRGALRARPREIEHTHDSVHKHGAGTLQPTGRRVCLFLASLRGPVRLAFRRKAIEFLSRTWFRACKAGPRSGASRNRERSCGWVLGWVISGQVRDPT